MKSTETCTKTPLPYEEDKTGELHSHEEKRQHPRYPVHLPLDLWLAPGLVLGGVVTDLNEVGLGFKSTHEIGISTEVGIRVYLLRGEFSLDSIEGRGRIIWRTPHEEQGWKGYRYGMYIWKMATYSRDRLMRYIQRLQEEGNSSR